MARPLQQQDQCSGPALTVVDLPSCMMAGKRSRSVASLVLDLGGHVVAGKEALHSILEHSEILLSLLRRDRRQPWEVHSKVMALSVMSSQIQVGSCWQDFVLPPEVRNGLP